MNKYNISFTMYQIIDGKISNKDHFSNCRAVIEGDTFEDAVDKFKKQKYEEGYALAFIVEGEMFNIEFFDLETRDKVKNNLGRLLNEVVILANPIKLGITKDEINKSINIFKV